MQKVLIIISCLFLFACTGTPQKVKDSSEKADGVLIVMEKSEVKLEDINFKKYSQSTSVKNDIKNVSELYMEIMGE